MPALISLKPRGRFAVETDQCIRPIKTVYRSGWITLKDMNVISLLKRLGSFRKAGADDIPATRQPMRPDLSAPANDRSANGRSANDRSANDRSDTTGLTPASWPSGERKQRQLQSWGSDL